MVSHENAFEALAAGLSDVEDDIAQHDSVVVPPVAPLPKLPTIQIHTSELEMFKIKKDKLVGNQKKTASKKKVKEETEKEASVTETPATDNTEQHQTLDQYMAEIEMKKNMLQKDAPPARRPNEGSTEDMFKGVVYERHDNEVFMSAKEKSRKKAKQLKEKVVIPIEPLPLRRPQDFRPPRRRFDNNENRGNKNENENAQKPAEELTQRPPQKESRTNDYRPRPSDSGAGRYKEMGGNRAPQRRNGPKNFVLSDDSAFPALSAVAT